jgi:heme oxygenase
MFSLKITSLKDFEYKIEILKNEKSIWQIIAPEIDLDETLTKVLEITQNLRQNIDGQMSTWP